MTETYKQKMVKENTINVRVEERVFKHIYAIGREYDTTMSDVVRLCIDLAVNQVEDIMKQTHALKYNAKL